VRKGAEAWSSYHPRRTRRWHDDVDIPTSRSWSPCAGHERDDCDGGLSAGGDHGADVLRVETERRRAGLSELRELRQLREEHTTLKRPVADLSLDRHRLQEIVRKTRCGRTRGGGEPRALRVSTLDGLVPTGGGRVNAKRLSRRETEEGLMVRTTVCVKAERRAHVPQAVATAPNQRWSMDVMSARVAESRGFRMLTVVDQVTRECLCVTADQSLTGEKVACWREDYHLTHLHRALQDQAPASVAAHGSATSRPPQESHEWLETRT